MLSMYVCNESLQFFSEHMIIDCIYVRHYVMIASKWHFPLNLNRKKPGLHPADNFPGVFRIKIMKTPRQRRVDAQGRCS